MNLEEIYRDGSGAQTAVGMGRSFLRGSYFPALSGRGTASAAPAGGLDLEERKTALPGVAKSPAGVLR
jgi:hypothetical protein